MKSAIIVISILSFASLIYAMDSDEGSSSNSHGCTLGDVFTAKGEGIKVTYIKEEPIEGEIVIGYRSISSLACDNVKKEYTPLVTKLCHTGSYLINAKITHLSVFENLKELKLENCFIQRLEFDADKVLPALKIASFASNYLTIIKLKELLKAMPQLQQLDLSWNPIKEIVVDSEYEHGSLESINLTKMEYLEQAKKDEFADKIKNSPIKGKKPVIGW